MIDKFEPAVNFVMANEATKEQTFVDDPNDSGGATNYGISLRLLQSIPIERRKKYGIFADEIVSDDVRNLTVDQVKSIYRGEFWEHVPYLDKVLDTRVRNYIFDCCVHHGIAQGIKIAQRASWSIASYYGHKHIFDDGVFGDDTLRAITFVDYPMVLMCERAGFVRMLVAMNPKNEPFLQGWLNRAYRI